MVLNTLSYLRAVGILYKKYHQSRLKAHTTKSKGIYATMKSLQTSKTLEIIHDVTVKGELKDGYLSKKIKQGKEQADVNDKGNALFNLSKEQLEPYSGVSLFMSHIILFGWPESDDYLNEVIDFIESNEKPLLEISYEEIIDFWGVEGCCVLGGIECSDPKNNREIDLDYPWRKHPSLSTYRRLQDLVAISLNVSPQSPWEFEEKNDLQK